MASTLEDMFSNDAMPQSIDPSLMSAGVVAQDEEEELDDLFGDVQEGATGMPVFSLNPELTAEEVAQRDLLEYNEAVLPIEGPLLEGPTEQIASLYLVKLPAFLTIDSKPFDEYLWQPPEQDPEIIKLEADDKDKIRANLPDENVIRWRWIKDPATGMHKRQSNARFIRWDDGALSVQIGSEIFDITAHKDETGHNKQSLTYLVADHVYCGLLETQVRITGTMNLTPTTIHSKAHRKLASTVKKAHTKVTKTRLNVLEQDPEHEAAERARKEKEKDKEARKAQRAATGGAGGGRRTKGSMRSRRLDVYSDDEEDLDEPEPEAPIGDFIEEDEEEDAAGGVQDMEIDNGPDDDLDMMDKAAEAAARKERKKAGAAAPAADMEVDQPEITTVNKRRLVIEGSDEE